MIWQYASAGTLAVLALVTAPAIIINADHLGPWLFGVTLFVNGCAFATGVMSVLCAWQIRRAAEAAAEMASDAVSEIVPGILHDLQERGLLAASFEFTELNAAAKQAREKRDKMN